MPSDVSLEIKDKMAYPRKITMKILVEYDDYCQMDGDCLRLDFKDIESLIKGGFAEGMTVTCLSIERDGDRVLD